MSILRKYISGLVGLLFPQLCLACNGNTPIQGADFCVTCLTDLPYTIHFDQEDNDFRYHFYGRVNLIFGAALLIFNKENLCKDMLHRLKYKRHKKVGSTLGKELGQKMQDSVYFKDLDFIVPVPIHGLKAVDRGYNQSEVIADGIAEILKLPVETKLLEKKAQTQSLTKLGRTDRVALILESLKANPMEDLAGKHILLVDDVLTTGATLEACAIKILEIAAVKISMVTLAITKS